MRVRVRLTFQGWDGPQGQGWRFQVLSMGGAYSPLLGGMEGSNDTPWTAMKRSGGLGFGAVLDSLYSTL